MSHQSADPPTPTADVSVDIFNLVPDSKKPDYTMVLSLAFPMKSLFPLLPPGFSPR